MTYHLLGFARKHGAIGIFYWVARTIEADSLESAKAEFRKEYETRCLKQE